jgi:RNA polymerase sigma-70 factor (ECF subfamily)
MRLGIEEVGGSAAVGDGAAPLPDEVVVRRVLAGETALFELIMRRYNQRLYRAARAILRDDSEAEDVVQETYLRALRAMGGFEWRASFATWLTRIAVHEACARRRARRRELPRIAEGVREESDMALRRREAGVLLREHIDALPASMRVVLVLRAVEGLGTRETAECLGLEEGVVKVRLHRAKAALRKSMAVELVGELKSVYAFDGERCDRIVRSVMERAAGELSH